MNPSNRLWLGIAVLAFCLGIAIGRLAIPVGTTKSATRAESTSNNQSSTIQADATTVRDTSQSKNNRRSESANVEGRDQDIYAQIKDVLTATGTARLYDSFGKFSNLIDQNNVREVLVTR